MRFFSLAAKGQIKENCALYISSNKSIDADLIRHFARDSRVELISEDGSTHWVSIIVSLPSGSRLIINKGPEAAELAFHLDGLQGYTWHIAGEELTWETWELMKRLARVKHVVGIVIQKADKDSDKLIQNLALSSHALMFHGNSIFDPQNRMLLGPGRKSDDAAAIPIFESALKRKERSELTLKNASLDFNPSLPALEGDEELSLQNSADLARRSVVLWAVYRKSNGDAYAEKLIDQAGLWNYLSPKESKFLKEAKPSEADIRVNSWRAEALWTILWALAEVPDLDLECRECDVEILADTMQKLCGDPPDNAKSFIANAKLRPAGEILDKRDLFYRLNWLMVNNHARGKTNPGTMADTVHERHYALNWISKYQNAQWDDVSTDT